MYESRIMVVNRFSKGSRDAKGCYWGDVIASVNAGFVDFRTDYLFKENANIYIYSDDDKASNEAIYEDDFGQPFKCAKIEDVIKAFEIQDNLCHKRRYSPVIAMLKGFDMSEWDDLIVVHYAY